MFEIKGELSTKQIIKLTIPLFLEQMVLLSLPVINSILVSSAGQAALSGVSLVDQITVMLSYLFLYSMCGISIVAAQYFGRKDRVNLRQSIQQAFAASNIVSMAILLIMLLFGNLIIETFVHGADPQIMLQAKNYFKILIFSFPFFSFYSVCVASLRGIGNTRLAMVVSIVQNVSSIAFSSILIYVFQMGVYGAAFGMIGGRVIGALIGAILLKKSEAIDRIRDMFHFKPDFDMQKKIFKFGFPQSMEAIIFMLAKVIISMFILKLGIDQVAANAAALPITDFQISGASAFIITATTIVAYAKGTNDSELAKKYMKKSFLLTSIVVAVTALGSIPLLPSLLSFYHLSEASYAIALRVLTIQAIVQTITYPSSFMLQGGFKGAGDVVFPSAISIITVWCIRLPASYLFAVVFGWGTLGLFFGMWSDFFIRSVIYQVHWIRGKWLRYKSV